MSKRERVQVGGSNAKRAKVVVLKGGHGISEQDLKNTDAASIKKELNAYVKVVAQMVDDDWHDGYEKQGVQLGKYKRRLGDILQSVYNVAITLGKAFVRCHEAIKILTDTWANMESIPIRGGMEYFFSSEYCGTEPLVVSDIGTERTIFKIERGDEIAEKIWSRFLIAAAACTTDQRVSNEQLCRFIKDAADYEVNVLSNLAPEDAAVTHSGETDHPRPPTDGADPAARNETSANQPDGAPHALADPSASPSPGLARLTALYQDKERWETLPTTRKVHKERRCIDRRFSGSVLRRTRGFGGYFF